MDMTEDNDLLLKQFFNEAAQQTIEDNGFTDRVIRQLPERKSRFVFLWNMACVAVFLVLFVVFRGWDLLAVHFEVMLRTLSSESFSINLLMMAVVLFGLLFVGVGEVISSEIARK
jgi:hypothetical protein